MKKLLLVLIVKLVLLGCIQNYYKYDGNFGYTDIAMGNGNFQIEYVEKGKHGDLAIKKKCIIRAAEIAKYKGYNYFLIIDEENKIISDDIFVEGKTVIEEVLDDQGKKKFIETHTPSHYKEQYKTIVQITVQYKHQKEEDVLSVQEILAMAVKEGYIKL